MSSNISQHTTAVKKLNYNELLKHTLQVEEESTRLKEIEKAKRLLSNRTTIPLLPEHTVLYYDKFTPGSKIMSTYIPSKNHPTPSPPFLEWKPILTPSSVAETSDIEEDDEPVFNSLVHLYENKVTEYDRYRWEGAYMEEHPFYESVAFAEDDIDDESSCESSYELSDDELSDYGVKYDHKRYEEW